MRHFQDVVDDIRNLYGINGDSLSEAIKAIQTKLWGQMAKIHSDDITWNDYWEYERDDLVSELESAIASEIEKLTRAEMIFLLKQGWFEDVDVEENDGMLFLSGTVTRKFNRLTNSHNSLTDGIGFWAENGELQLSHGKLGRQPLAFAKLIAVASAYWQMSYGKY